jgi:hypothetical protein
MFPVGKYFKKLQLQGKEVEIKTEEALERLIFLHVFPSESFLRFSTILPNLRKEGSISV